MAGSAALPRAAASPRPGWRRPLAWLRWGSLVAPLALLLVISAVSWRAERARAHENAAQLAELVAQYALRVIETQSVVLADLADKAGGRDLATDDLGDLHREMAATVARFDFVFALGVATAGGEIVASSTAYPIRIDISDRDYFRAARLAPETLVLDRADLRPRGVDAVVIARGLRGERFDGVVVSTVNVRAFTDFFGRIADDGGASASILRADGKLLVRHFPEAPAMTLPDDAPARRAVATAPRGTYEAVAISDGIERVYGYTQIGEHPLYANFGLATASIRAAWLRSTAPAAALLALAAALGFVAAGQAVRRFEAVEAAERARADRRLLEEAQKTAAFRETLLREMHHRVKNNLHQVQALLQLRAPADEAGREALRAVEDRVWAIAEVHDLLYASGSLTRLDLAALVVAICRNPSIAPPERGIEIACDVEPVEVGVETGAPLALIVVELLTNALKHAFPDGRTGRVAVALRRGEDGGAVLVVEDDGVGLPPEDRRRRSSGLRLVEALSRQIGARLTVESGGAGARFAIEAPGDGQG